MKKVHWGPFYGALLAAFSCYILLDTFAFQRIYKAVPQETAALPTQEAAAEETEPEILSSANSYQDANITVTVTQFRAYDSEIYVADVQIASAEYLKTALARAAYGKNLTQNTSDIARDNQAILAINGDYYGSRESGYVLRNGILYRDQAAKDQEDLVVWSDGSFSLITETEISASALAEQGAMQIFSFGPGLGKNGEVCVSESAEVGKAKASNPRTAIGIIEPLHYLLVVSDGRTEESAGLSLYELAQVMQSLGAQTAYNLDGGGSSAMYFQGEIVNQPTTNGKAIKERSVSDIVYIGY